MDCLRIGVIGLGWFGEIHAETIAGVPNLELAALCTRTPDRLAAMGEKFGVKKLYRDYSDMLADPEIDAVSICTMWDQHTEPAIAALKAGKHVFLEKPIASTVEDAREITAASKGAKGILFIGHVVRFNPRYRMAKQAIDEGRIGKIVALSSRRNIPAAWTPTILNKIGPIVGDAIHDTDIMLWFTGERWSRPMRRRSTSAGSSTPISARPCTASPAARPQRWRRSGACPKRRRSTSTSACRSSAPRASSTSRTRSPTSHRRQKQAALARHDLLADVQRRARRGAARRIQLFCFLRAEGQAGDHRHARGCDRRTRSDARRRGIGPHRQCGEDRLMLEYVFDHVGITTTEPQPQEDWVEACRIWVTNPRNHPEHIEFLRYREDSTVPAAVRDNPHVALHV